MYDFDKIVDRTNELSYKWDIPKNVLPMWVADMDFEVLPEITEAIINRALKKTYGYNIVPKEFQKAISSFWERRHNFIMEEDKIIFSAGVVPTISSVVRKLTTPAENVVVLTPCYNIFFNSILNNGRNVLECPLILKNNEYEIDFIDLEEKLKNPQTSLMILCNPHNPIGKIWSKNELEKIGNLCNRYNVVVLSDEIHCDIVEPNLKYIPFSSVNEICKNISITCISATKCFNMAGIQASAFYAYNDNLRYKVKRAINTDEVAEPNTFAIQASIAAFNNGDRWLDEMNQYVMENRRIVKKYIEENIKDLTLINSNSTYLLWIDASKICNDSKMLQNALLKNGLYLSYGGDYGGNSKAFLRMNIATSKINVLEGLKRLKNGIDEYIGYKS